MIDPFLKRMVHLGKKPATKKKTDQRLTGGGEALTLAARLGPNTEFSWRQVDGCSCYPSCNRRRPDF